MVRVIRWRVSWGNPAHNRRTKMLKIVCTALVLSSALILGAIHAKAESNPQTYADAMRQCGAEWRASEQRKSVAKGEGNAAWQAFRKECTARVGYTKKSRAARTTSSE
jgi:hypothetical protein